MVIPQNVKKVKITAPYYTPSLHRARNDHLLTISQSFFSLCGRGLPFAMWRQKRGGGEEGPTKTKAKNRGPLLIYPQRWILYNTTLPSLRFVVIWLTAVGFRTHGIIQSQKYEILTSLKTIKAILPVLRSTHFGALVRQKASFKRTEFFYTAKPDICYKINLIFEVKISISGRLVSFHVVGEYASHSLTMRLLLMRLMSLCAFS